MILRYCGSIKPRLILTHTTTYIFHTLSRAPCLCYTTSILKPCLYFRYYTFYSFPQKLIVSRTLWFRFQKKNMFNLKLSNTNTKVFLKSSLLRRASLFNPCTLSIIHIQFAQKTFLPHKYLFFTSFACICHHTLSLSLQLLM